MHLNKIIFYGCKIFQNAFYSLNFLISKMDFQNAFKSPLLCVKVDLFLWKPQGINVVYLQKRENSTVKQGQRKIVR